MRWSGRSAGLFIAFGACVLGVFNIVARMPINGPKPAQSMAIAYRNVPGRDAVSLGGSSARALDFEAMCIDGSRFFHSSQDAFEIEALVQLILSNERAPKYFFLVIAPETLHHDNASVAFSTSSRRRYTYQFLHSIGQWGLIDDDWRYAALSEAVPDYGDQFRFDLQEGLKIAFTGQTPRNFQAEDDKQAVTAEENTRMARQSATEWKELARKQAYFAPETLENAASAITRSVKRVQDADKQVIIVPPPYMLQLQLLMRSDVSAAAIRYERLMRETEALGAVVLDLRDLAATHLGPEYFRDAAHLNSIGSWLFSKKAGQELRHRGVILQDLRNSECS